MKLELKRNLRVVLVALLSIASAGCSWLTDFRQQPSIAPWQSLDVNWADTSTPFRGNPQGSVSTAGTAVAAYQVSYRRLPTTVDSMSSIPNPIPVTQESVDRGWKYFQTTCAVCHGNAGGGDGLVTRYGGVSLNLVAVPTVARTDGYLFGQIRNGGVLMPTMNRIDERDRWHIVNYLRGLQGKLPASIVVRKEPPGLPGETGATLPGYTGTAPTRAAPFAKPVYVPTGGTVAGGTAKQEERK